MPTKLDLLIRSLDRNWHRDDIIWLAQRIGWRDLSAEEASLQRVEIPIWFFRALVNSRRGRSDGRFSVTLESHGATGVAAARFVHKRAFLEWNVDWSVASADGVYGAFAVFALISDGRDTVLWSWICETLAEDEYAEGLFGHWGIEQVFYRRSHFNDRSGRFA